MSRNYQRFGYNGREIRGRILPPPAEADIYAWLDESIRDLYRQLAERGEPSDFIGITINSESFRHGPVWMSFRPIRNFHANDLFELLFSVTQSANDFNIDDALSITCGIVKGVAGQGRVKLTEQDVNKKSILKIRNDDNLCFPRSLVTSYAYAVRGQIRSGQLHDYWNRIRVAAGTTQREAAKELTRLANVEIPESGCEITEIDSFQEYLATLGAAIVVYAFSNYGRGNRPLYDGTNFVARTNGRVDYTLRIMYYEVSKHFQPILNMVGATGSAGYCIPCNQSYWRVEDHRCSRKCRQCMRAPPCEMTENTRHCNVCNRNFYDDVCFEFHQTIGSFDRNNSVCNKKKMCGTCFKIINVNRKGKEHVCGVTYCRTCKMDLPTSHLCHMQPVRTSAPKSKIVYVFFDFEAQQTTTILGDEEKKIHEPNLCVVHQVCSACLNIQDISTRCEQCGIREYVFSINPVKQLVDLVLSLSKPFKQCICISHNGQSYDNQFVFRHLVSNHCERIKPEVILNGSKIILMEYLNIKFLDSLLYFHLPLSSLPKAYGLHDIQKGYFCHFFNTPENQHYIGPMPPMERMVLTR